MVTYSITDALSTFYLHKYPFMRLIIPWITGVFCGDCFFDSSPGIFWVSLAFCLFFGLSMTFYFLQRYSLRWCFGVSLPDFNNGHTSNKGTYLPLPRLVKGTLWLYRHASDRTKSNSLPATRFSRFPVKKRGRTVSLHPYFSTRQQ